MTGRPIAALVLAVTGAVVVGIGAAAAGMLVLEE